MTFLIWLDCSDTLNGKRRCLFPISIFVGWKMKTLLRAFVDGFNTNTYGKDWKSVLEQNLVPHSINQPKLPAKVSSWVHRCGRQIKQRLTDPKNAYAVETHHPPETSDMGQSYVACSCIPDSLRSYPNASCFHNPASQLLLFNGYIYKKPFGPSCVPP